tara:strand:+ start:4455 stop:4574 length:120 start_codon:yes stop_codon:yes gene_type:complete
MHIIKRSENRHIDLGRINHTEEWLLFSTIVVFHDQGRLV